MPVWALAIILLALILPATNCWVFTVPPDNILDVTLILSNINVFVTYKLPAIILPVTVRLLREVPVTVEITLVLV